MARLTRRSRLHAFTLPELLVVIGIIALLLGILLPALARAREQARAAVCMSNQRQIALAVLAYAQENKGALIIPLGAIPPRPFEPVFMVNFGLYDWNRGSLLPYVGSSVDVRRRVFSCPSDPDPRFAGDNLTGQSLPQYPRNFSYNFNASLNATLHRGRFGYRLNEIYEGWHKILVMEMERPRFTAGVVNGLAPDPSAPAGYHVSMVVGSLTARHGGYCNFAAFDGHCERLDPRIFAVPTKPGGGIYTTTPTVSYYTDPQGN